MNKANKIIDTLPNKPSELIRVALADLAKVERSPKYDVNMNLYHYPHGKICSVCFAGAVLAKSLKVNPKDKIYPNEEDFMELNPTVFNKLRFLDAVRGGDMFLANDWMDIPVKHLDNIGIANYSEDPKAFKSDMRKLAKNLEKSGA